MARIRRNQSCPCGSGKKYKHCCLARDRRLRSREPPGADAVSRALAWLDERYEEEMLAAFAVMMFLGFDDEMVLALASFLPAPLVELVNTMGRELVLAEGKLALEGGETPCLDLVLGAGGPSLSDDQREYLETLGRREISFYEVLESKPGSGFRLRDLLDEDEPVRWVEEPVLSQALAAAQGAVFGARLMPGRRTVGDRTPAEPWRIQGGIYPQQLRAVPHLLSDVLAAFTDPRNPLGVRRTRSMFAVQGWLGPLSVTPPGAWAEAGATLTGPPS